jgi:hypothetical protein
VLVHFKHGGRRYSLRKRSPERDAPWYLVGVVAGKRMQRSLDTNVADIARQRIEPRQGGHERAGPHRCQPPSDNADRCRAVLQRSTLQREALEEKGPRGGRA